MPEHLLRKGLVQLGLQCSEQQVARLLQFHDLLLKWGRTYNLTAIRDSGSIVSLHLLDSLAVLPYIQGERVLDIGTGAGLPGLPLAVVSGKRAFYLLDSSSKKIRFIRQAVLELGLDNVHLVNMRAEQYRPEAAFDTLVTRAFAALPDTLGYTQHLLTRHNRLLAMKGQRPGEEIEQLSGIDYTIVPLAVPGVDAERHLVCLSKR